MSIQNYGQHPTQYARLSDDEFYANFRASNWETLNDDTRLEVLQEAVNRSAAANGEIGSCTVRWGDQMNSSTYAQQGGDYITINHDRFAQYADNNARGEPMSDAGMKALEAALHEDQHAYQNQIIHDVIQAPDPELEKEYKANDVVAIPMENGAYGSSYLRSDTVEYYMYYFQSTERDAFRNSQQQTREIMQRQAELIRTEIAQMNETSAQISPDTIKDLQAYAAYANTLATSGYYAQHRMAENYFAYPEFESDLNTSLTNIYYNEHRPLADESMQASVQDAMQVSYFHGQMIDHSHGAGVQHSSMSSAALSGPVADNSFGFTPSGGNTTSFESDMTTSGLSADAGSTGGVSADTGVGGGESVSSGMESGGADMSYDM